MTAPSIAENAAVGTFAYAQIVSIELDFALR